MIPDFTKLDASLITHLAQSVTYQPAGSANYSLNGILTSGDDVEENEPGTHFSLFARATDFTREPAKMDTVLVPAARPIPAGVYRVADVRKDTIAGRKLLLVYSRTA
jgi:hypothetical protein